MINLEFLEKVDVFRKLNDDQLSAIQKCAEVIDFKKNDRIFEQGDVASYVWILLEGNVELRTEPGDQEGRADSSPAFLSEAQAFGWTCFVQPNRYRLSGYCASRLCKIIRLERDDLLAIFAQDVVVGFRVMNYLLKAVGKQFEQLQERIAKDRGIEMMSQW